MPTMLGIHLFAAVCAIGVGAFQLSAQKGTMRHKKIGWLWLIAMSTTALSSFFLYGHFLNSRFSPVHVLSVWVLVCVVASVYFARTGNIRRHRRFVVGSYLGLIGAGLGTLAPGRLIGGWLFGG